MDAVGPLVEVGRVAPKLAGRHGCISMVYRRCEPLGISQCLHHGSVECRGMHLHSHVLNCNQSLVFMHTGALMGEARLYGLMAD